MPNASRSRAGFAGPTVFILFTSIFFNGTAAAERYTFQSPFDKFELVTNGMGRGSVEGKPADMATIKDLLPLLHKTPDSDCGTLRDKPTLTVKYGNTSRSIYVKAGLLSDGKTCLSVGGDGLFYFPLHRDFLIGARDGAIQLRSPLKIYRQGNKILSLRKAGESKEWQSETQELLIDWDFFERFENSLASYNVRARVQNGLADGKSKVLVQSADAAYEFYRLGPNMWAVKRPGMKWLETSNEWGFWTELEKEMFEDRNTTEIRVAQDMTKDKDVRMAALDGLAGSWSRNLRDLYHKLLLGENDADLQSLALKRLKHKPSLETAGVMVKFLQTSHDEELRRDAGVILKLQNPKGPLYKVDLTPAEKDKVIDFWRQWWASLAKGS